MLVSISSACLDIISTWILCIADGQVCLRPYVGAITIGLIRWGETELSCTILFRLLLKVDLICAGKLLPLVKWCGSPWSSPRFATRSNRCYSGNRYCASFVTYSNYIGNAQDIISICRWLKWGFDSHGALYS